jgi:hypothetical protein
MILLQSLENKSNNLSGLQNPTGFDSEAAKIMKDSKLVLANVMNEL